MSLFFVCFTQCLLSAPSLSNFIEFFGFLEINELKKKENSIAGRVTPHKFSIESLNGAAVCMRVFY